MSGGDTIAALSSAAGDSAVAILRISGRKAADVFSALCPEARSVNIQGFFSSDLELKLPGLDPVCSRVYFFKAPNSYTTEDTVELHLPGSPLLVRRILLALVDKGARAAQPGEFTRRAFTGGRIDLVQAEAVCAIIESKNNAELKAAEYALAGSLSKDLVKLSEKLDDLRALVEVSIDFSDQDIEPVSLEDIKGHARQALDLLSDMRTHGAQKANENPNILICGMPNVGKSTLFNKLLGHDRAIVSGQAGTTRDIVSANIKFGDSTVTLSDSAGKKHPDGDIEQIAISMLQDNIKWADIILFVIEAHKLPEKTEMDFYQSIECNKILVANKSDLGISPDKTDCISISCKTGNGIEKLKEQISRMLHEKVERHPDILMFNVRQKQSLKQACEALERSLDLSDFELIAEELRDAVSSLKEITGETVSMDILDRIFSRFCIGK